MTVIAQSGIFGFGPQGVMGTLASTFYRHKAGDIDMAPVDDVRVGPPEIGGVPVPTIPYKAGSLAAGGATIYPRLENTLGWLLYGAMGGYTVSGSAGGVGFPEVCMARKYLTATTQTITSGITSPTSGSGTRLIVRGWRDGSSAITGNVIITGTTSGSSTVESITLSDKSEVQSAYTWTAITSVQLPARTNSDGNDAVSVGWYDVGMRAHKFAFDSTNNSFVPFMSMRKLIPGSNNSPTLGEQFLDCKILGATFTLPNEGLIGCRVDAMGRTFVFVDNPEGTWSWANTYEDYTSIPIGCTTGGYISVPSFGDRPLPVVACTVGIQNNPLDIRQERIFGSPDLEDITITGRQLVFDVTCKWRDPSLYRAITTGSKTGTSWTTIPFVKSLDVFARSPGFAAGGNAPYGLRIESDAVMWQMAGGVRLVGNQMVSVRLQGTALDVSGNYARMTLINRQAAYNWPAS
jgi:hypothetical protein